MESADATWAIRVGSCIVLGWWWPEGGTAYCGSLCAFPTWFPCPPPSAPTDPPAPGATCPSRPLVLPILQPSNSLFQACLYAKWTAVINSNMSSCALLTHLWSNQIWFTEIPLSPTFFYNLEQRVEDLQRLDKSTNTQCIFFLQTQGFHQNTSSRRNKSPNQNTRSRLKQVQHTINENFSSNLFFSVCCYLLLRSLQCSSSARPVFLSTSTDPLLSLPISEQKFPRRWKTTTANVVVCVRGSRDVVFAGSRALSVNAL
jgi:hypothetical protein